MGSCFPTIIRHSNRRQCVFTKSEGKVDVPKGYLAVYVGETNETKTRFLVPILYLKHPKFQDLLRFSEEEYGFDYPMGGLTIPCSENAFLNVTSYLQDELQFQGKGKPY
ncbi:hypothetical protein ABFS82_07G058100 [Erythranthe guttata]|uniref:Uncharacterized protein n=1 Tax=Erythranthe guttata TaxID=4155 RepID=A0A022RVL5_ERYGU|nr:PREDICTED: auxin-induced protein X15-like [Erythranthe guttata]EYU43813.1 hypothetical protein MIMGU_mgv1a024258mg [Erythranthe guttata]|eukprot:XP_012829514.1 PREDICTED: auxin-induced protein X15-like [Erythranthe guttata]